MGRGGGYTPIQFTLLPAAAFSVLNKVSRDSNNITGCLDPTWMLFCHFTRKCFFCFYIAIGINGLLHNSVLFRKNEPPFVLSSPAPLGSLIGKPLINTDRNSLGNIKMLISLVIDRSPKQVSQECHLCYNSLVTLSCWLSSSSYWHCIMHSDIRANEDLQQVRRDQNDRVLTLSCMYLIS